MTEKHLPGEIGTVLGYNDDESISREIKPRYAPSRLSRIVGAFKPVREDDGWDGSQDEIEAEKIHNQGVRRLVYAAFGEIVGAGAIAAGTAANSRNAVYAGIAAMVLSTLYLGKRYINKLRKKSLGGRLTFNTQAGLK
ncbi:hypothetical protein FJZ19_03745 [Candidatus Pacearchaeota archaeon]|nr:hypothetical protein [Candidatus Pacearchaeota archaeon]